MISFRAMQWYSRLSSRHVFFSVFVACIPALSQAAPSYDAEIDSLMQTLEVQTDIATKTKMNADFVPGMVTVLQGHDLQSMGLRDVWEALQLVPGFNVSKEPDGILQVFAHGVGGVMSSSEVKILLNGRDTSAVFGGVDGQALMMPVHMVERIEVMRGPGSVLYGDYAYMGVINVVLRETHNQIFTQLGSDRSGQLGVLLSQQVDDFSFHINTSKTTTDGQKPWIASDALQASGTPDSRFRSEHVSASVKYADTELYTNYTKYLRGSSFGTNYGLGISNPLPLTRDFLVGLKQDVTISDDTDASVDASYGRFGYDRKFLKSMAVFGLSTPGVKHQMYKEENHRVSAQLQTRLWSSHDVLLGAAYESQRILRYVNEYDYVSNWANYPAQPPYIAAPLWKDYGGTGQDRMHGSVFLQDQYIASDALRITMGARFDQFNDMGGNVSPRVALVYSEDERHIFKLQFSQAFRPPTPFEIADFVGIQNNLVPEQSSAVDAGYIYKQGKQTVRLTGYRYWLRHFIYDASFATYDNETGLVHVQGADVEYENTIGDAWSLKSDVSYIHTYNARTKRPLYQSVNWLGNVRLGYDVRHDVHVDVWLHGVGPRYREPNDPRGSKAKGYVTLNPSMTWTNVYGSKGLKFQAGVRNASNADVRYVTPLNDVTYFGNPNPYTYVKDMPVRARSYWMQLSQQF